MPGIGHVYKMDKLLRLLTAFAANSLLKAPGDRQVIVTGECCSS